jgi:DHA1 family multidrug resistance protein-like MFS transporter
MSPDWRRTLALLVTLQATMASGFNVSAPFMPFFLVQLGVAPMSAVALWTGAIAAVGALVITFTSPYWGGVADRIGRKPMVQRTALICAGCFLLVPFCTSPWHVLGAFALSGLFGGFSASAMALVGTQAPVGRLGFALGWMATGQLAGSLAGPLIGGLLADRVHDYRFVFVWVAGAIIVVTAVTTSLVREQFERPAPGHQRMSLRQQALEIVRHPTLLPLIFVLFLAQVTTFAPIPVIPLFVHGLTGDVRWLGTASGVAIAITGVAGVLATPWLGRLGDRIGHRPVLAGSLVGVALFTFPQVLAGDLWTFVALRFGAGLFLGGMLPATNALIGRAFPVERRGRIYGITNSAGYLGLALGPIAGGLIAARFGYPSVFVGVGAIVLLALALVALRGEPRLQDETA